MALVTIVDRQLDLHVQLVFRAVDFPGPARFLRRTGGVSRADHDNGECEAGDHSGVSATAVRCRQFQHGDTLRDGMTG